MEKLKKFLYQIWSKFLVVFGDIRVFKWPMWVVYDPNYFQMTGDKILDMMRIIQPGDVVLRGYNSYLDSAFIDGDYSHAGIYVGGNKIIHAVHPKVAESSIIDFAECDRIAVCRPVKDQKKALRLAKNFLKNGIPYDFGFNTKDMNALYCFELAARCYPKLEIKTFETRKIFGLVRKIVYLASSFKTSGDFKTVFEYNPKRSVDFSI